MNIKVQQFRFQPFRKVEDLNQDLYNAQLLNEIAIFIGIANFITAFLLK